MAGDAGAADELAAFEAGDRDPASFHHLDHVRVAYEMTGRYGFDEALARYARGLRRMCARVGHVEKYHMTITVAFLALVAERRTRASAVEATWGHFARANDDLLSTRCLHRWYDPTVLASDIARRTFVLPSLRQF